MSLFLVLVLIRSYFGQNRWLWPTASVLLSFFACPPNLIAKVPSIDALSWFQDAQIPSAPTCTEDP